MRLARLALARVASHPRCVEQALAWLIGEGAVPYRDAFDMNPPGVYRIHWAILSIGGRRIGNMNALRRQSPRPWARHGDPRCQTRTLAALGAVGTADRYVRAAPCA